MSPRSLFVIIIRILGILSFRTFIVAFFQTLGRAIVYAGTADDSMIWYMIPQFVVVAVYFFVTYILIFKAGYIVDRLKLSADITPVLQFKIDTRDVLRIALMITAGLLLVNEVPEFIASVARLLGRDRLELLNTKPDNTAIIVSAVKVLIGLLMIGERNRILDLIYKKQDDDDTKDETPDQPEGDLFPQEL